MMADDCAKETLDEEQKEPALNIYGLPFDVLFQIFALLDHNDLVSLSQVNKKLNLILNDDYLWFNKLLKDVHKWKKIDSLSWPRELFELIDRKYAEAEGDEQQPVSYKRLYMTSCPDTLTKKEILARLRLKESQQAKGSAVSSAGQGQAPASGQTQSNGASISGFSMPTNLFGQFKNFFYKNVAALNETFNITGSGAHGSGHQTAAQEMPSKLVMFGPGLETITSCLVTNMFKSSEFKQVNMVPGRNGYGSGIVLKLFNHKPFNLTILYTHVSKVRQNNENHDLRVNRLLVASAVENSADGQVQYELQDQVKDAISDADGFVYVVDTHHRALELDKKEKCCAADAAATAQEMGLIDNYKLELEVMTRETSKELPVLLLACHCDEGPSVKKSGRVSCAKIVQELEMQRLRQRWQIRSCDISNKKMRDLTLGFEWILNHLEQRDLIKQAERQAELDREQEDTSALNEAISNMTMML